MTLDEMEAARTEYLALEDDKEEAEGEDQTLSDLLDSLSLLSQCKRLLDYMSDPDLCKNLSKRERDSMSRLSEKLKDHLDALESSAYGEV